MADPKGPADPIDARLVRRLAAILNDTGLTEIEVERGDLRIKVARTAQLAFAPSALAPAPQAGFAAAAASASPAAPAAASAEPEGDVVASPMVGTVYLQPQPGAPPFVKVGDMVAEGQTLLIVEAMKTMNPIPAPRAGRLVELLVADGQPVEFGEALAVIG
ncbi:MAG: acetyl-CoA carboxylase biotin carboxyl carrier protein [Caulobacteraceae bacterium]|nr:acetyl-CoA carboxylase biotin carboxyl carrier protein [Caulobacteraceae bacterium]